jgi:hypothetical protein
MRSVEVDARKARTITPVHLFGDGNDRPRRRSALKRTFPSRAERWWLSKIIIGLIGVSIARCRVSSAALRAEGPSSAMKNASKRYARRPGHTRRRSVCTVWPYSVDCCQFKERLCRSIHFGPGPRM